MFWVALASLLPGIFWLWFFNRYDYLEKEPVINLILTSLAGAVAVVPALIWETPFARLLTTTNSVLVQFGLSFLVVGFGEELFKWLAVFFSAYKSAQFNEPMDGIIYGTAAAIGFSVVENVLYISSFGMSIAPLRATISTLAHIAFSGLGGYYLGLAKFSERPRVMLVRAVAVATLLHGAFDFLLITRLASPLVLVLAVLGLQALLFKAMERAVRISPFR